MILNKYVVDVVSILHELCVQGKYMMLSNNCNISIQHASAPSEIYMKLQTHDFRLGSHSNSAYMQRFCDVCSDRSVSGVD